MPALKNFAQHALGIFTVLSKAMSSHHDIRVPEDNVVWKGSLRIIRSQSLFQARPA